MISINPLFQVLVMFGNSAIATSGKRVDELKPGQLGIFDYETNLAITPTVMKTTPRFFFAVGKSTTGSTTVSNEVMKSASEYVQLSGVKNTVAKDYQAGVNQVLTYNIGTLQADMDYGIKLEVQSQEAFSNFGYNLPTKSFFVNSGPESDPLSGIASTEDFVDKMVAAINNDVETILTAAKVDADTFTVTVSADSQEMFGEVNLKYANPLGVKVTPSLINLEDTGSTVAETTAMVYEQGSGYDVNQREYEAGGWNGNPGVYRASDTTYLSGGEKVADKAGTYASLSVSYMNDGVGGGQTYQKSLLTEIVCPAGESTGLGALNALALALPGGKAFPSLA